MPREIYSFAACASAWAPFSGGGINAIQPNMLCRKILRGGVKRLKRRRKQNSYDVFGISAA